MQEHLTIIQGLHGMVMHNFPPDTKGGWTTKDGNLFEYKFNKEKEVKYKVGDKVTIRTDLVEGKRYGAESFVSMMAEFKGKTLVVKYVSEEDYQLEAGGNWGWTDEMFVENPPEEEPEVTVRQQFEVKHNDLRLMYVTGSKKDRVSIFNKHGHKIGYVRYDQTDNLVNMLMDLQGAVEIEKSVDEAE